MQDYELKEMKQTFMKVNGVRDRYRSQYKDLPRGSDCWRNTTPRRWRFRTQSLVQMATKVWDTKSWAAQSTLAHLSHHGGHLGSLLQSSWFLHILKAPKHT